MLKLKLEITRIPKVNLNRVRDYYLVNTKRHTFTVVTITELLKFVIKYFTDGEYKITQYKISKKNG